MTRFSKFAAGAAAIVLLPAMGQSATDMDADGDGLVTIAEAQAVYPDMTAEQFNQVDVNADGALDDTEVQAARDAGLMPES